ncbi:MAG: hypothetical protein ACI39Q_02720 [Wujia sp.]
MNFKEKCKNARAFIVLLAAMITLLLNIRYDRDLLESLIILIIVIAVFFVISTIAIRLIEKICNMESKHTSIPEEETESNDDESDSEES